MSFSPDALRPLLDREGGGDWCVAFSGGLDSTVLLHALAALRGAYDATLCALHVNHGLHADAGQWAEWCTAAAGRLGIDCEVLEVGIAPDDPDGPEAAARAARYTALAGAMRDGATLMIAQHADDQAETVLLALLRGSGPDGVAAMPAVSGFGTGTLLRPLLGFTRAELEAWARAQTLEWIEDPANRDLRYTRSWLRATVMPALTARSPGHIHSLARSARLAAEASALLDELATLDLGCAPGGVLPLALLQALSPARGRNLLRAWLRSQGLPLPSYPRLVEAHRQMLEAGPDRNPAVAWPGGVLRRYRDGIHAHPPLPEPPADWTARWDGGAPLDLPAGLGTLRLEPAHEGLCAARIRDTALEVRFRTGGERIRTAGSTHHSALKDLLQRSGVPPWERGRIPLVIAGGSLVAAGDRWVADAWQAKRGEAAVKVTWTR